MVFLDQGWAAFILITLTLVLQSAGMAALIQWIKAQFPKGITTWAYSVPLCFTANHCKGLFTPTVWNGVHFDGNRPTVRGRGSTTASCASALISNLRQLRRPDFPDR